MKVEPNLRATTWEVLPDAPGAVNDLSVGADGTIIVATDRGVYSYEAGAWQPVDTVSRSYYAAASAGDAQHMFAVIAWLPIHYYKTQTGWEAQQLPGLVRDISGARDGTVYAIADDAQGTVYAYDSMNSYVETSLKLDKISVGGRDLIYGTLNEQKSAFRIVAGEPILIGNNLNQVSVGADGTVWGVDGLGGVYYMIAGPDGTRWKPVGGAPALEQISVGNQYQVIGRLGDTIHRWQPEGYNPRRGEQLHGALTYSSTLRPNYRGRFLLGVSEGPGRDPDAETRVAANTGGMAKNNVGSVQLSATALPAAGFSTGEAGDHSHGLEYNWNGDKGCPNPSLVMPNVNATYYPGGSEQVNEYGQTSTKGAHTHPVSGGDRESRPINAYVYWLIKYQ